MKSAIISYNTFVPGEMNGWKIEGENSVLLLQNSNGEEWGMSQNGTTDIWKEEAVNIIDPLWKKLQEELKTIDVVVLYVGSYGAERVIKLASKEGLTPNRTVFVLCDCNFPAKMDVIEGCGFSSSKRISCECGGHNAMNKIFNKLLAGENI